MRRCPRQTYPSRVSRLSGDVPADLDLVHRGRHPGDALSLFSLEPDEVEIDVHVATLADDLVPAHYEVVRFEEASDVAVG